MASSAPSLLPAASRLGGYEIVALVGRGGMGEVYRAKQLSMEREVALKVLSPRLAKQDPAFAEQFVAEARAAGKLNHPNIVGVHDVGQAPAPEGCDGLAAGEPVHYFSMEFIDGETVKDVIERQGSVDLPTIGKVMAAMVEALAFAEAHKIVHRDIKPDNIMLTASGVVKLADLGLALQTDSTEAIEGSKDEQGRGKVMGTPLYMAPEQARAHPIDHRADQYALGATLFHMLVGRPPYQGESAKAIMRAHCFEPVPDPAEANPEVPPPWRELCLRMLAKLPDERFAGAADLRLAVRHAIRWKPGAPLRPRPTRSPPWLAIALGAAAALAGLWLFLLRPSSSDPSPHQIAVTGASDPVAEARARAERTLAALPKDPAAAVGELNRLIADPHLIAMRDQLLAQREQLAAVIEEQRRQPLRAAAEAVDAQLTAGKLSEARSGLAQLSSEAWLAERRKQLSERLAEAERTAEAQLIASIEAAADAAACAQLADAIAHAGLRDERRQAVLAKLDQRRSDLASAAQPKTQKVDTASLWRELGQRCETHRATLPYSTLADAFREGASAFPDAERAMVDQLAVFTELAQQAEAALRLHLGQTTPMLECRFGKRTGSFVITKLEKDWIGFRLPDVPAETRTPRATAVLPWDKLLSAALGTQPEGLRQSAAFLWFWNLEERRAALAKIANDPLAIAVQTYQRRIKPLDVAGDIDRLADGLLGITYRFAATRDPDLLSAWQGAGAELTERGLHWSSATRATSKAEADLPGLRWATSLAPPITLEATLQPDKGSEMLLIGLTSGDQTVRVCLARGGEFCYVATRMNGSGTYEQIKGNLVLTYRINEATRVRMAVDAAGKISAFVNDKAVPRDRELAFAADARLAPVIQGRGVNDNVGVVISTLSISGKP